MSEFATVGRGRGRAHPPPLAAGAADRREPVLQGMRSINSVLSVGSDSSVLSAGSILSVASTGSILSIGSSGSILSIGSAGSILSIGSVGSALSVGSFCSALSVRSAFSILGRGQVGKIGRREQTADAADNRRHGMRVITLLILAALACGLSR